jgi:UDP-N-acetylmuramoyl-L-alanyl-D-glutamate--2,6-diaminopimelate ligase
MLDRTLGFIRSHLIPRHIFSFFQPTYHIILSLFGAIIYRFPSRKIEAIGITGTKGKSTVTELVSAILEEAGYSTALTNTIRFKIRNISDDNV